MNRSQQFTIVFKWSIEKAIAKVTINKIRKKSYALFHDLKNKIHNEYVYIEIKKDMYGLKQAGILAYNELTKT